MKVIQTENGKLSILMGKSGLGKSTIAVYDSLDHIREGEKVLFFSYEYPQCIIYNKLINHFDLKWQDLFKVNIIDSNGLNLDNVLSYIEKSDASIVYIDYLDLLRNETYKNEIDDVKKNQNDQIICSKLAQLAEEKNINIVALVQEKESKTFEETISQLNTITSLIKKQNVVKMFIGRDGIFSSAINCNDISHVILVDGYNLKHFSSINVKEVYKD